MTNSLNIIKAIQKIYPTIQGGYCYWETRSNPKQDENGEPILDNEGGLIWSWDSPIDGLVWENTEFVKPTWEQIEAYLAEIDLQEAKDKKKAEIKALRDSNLEKPTPQTVDYGGNLLNKTIDVNVKIHLPIFESIISTLQRRTSPSTPNPTRGWTDISGERLSLSIDEFRSLANHLDERDDIEYSQAQLKIAALEDLTTLEEVEAFDINEIIV